MNRKLTYLLEKVARPVAISDRARNAAARQRGYRRTILQEADRVVAFDRAPIKAELGVVAEKDGFGHAAAARAVGAGGQVAGSVAGRRANACSTAPSP